MQWNKTKSRAILLSVLVALLCLAVILGATFALFTARREYEIGVNTGKIDVQGTLTLDKAWSESQAGVRTEVEANGATTLQVDQMGSVTVDGEKITFSNMSIGDGAAFSLAITNASTVKMQYSVSVSAQAQGGEALRDNLLVTVGDSELSLMDRAVYLQPWTKVEPTETQLSALNFEISLPWSALAAFEGQDVQSVTLTIVLEAVQANAQTADVSATVDNAADLQNALNAAQPGDEVQIALGGDVALAGTQFVVPEGISVTVDGNGQTITSTSRTFFNNAGADGITLDGVGKDAQIVIRNVDFVGPGGTGFAVILGPRDIGNAEVIIEDCTFTNMWSAVYCTATDNATVNLTIRNCTFTDTPYGYSIDRTSLKDPASFTANVTFEKNTGYDTESESAADSTVSNVGTLESLEAALSGAEAGKSIAIDLEEGTEIALENTYIELPAGADTITIDGHGATISSTTQYFFNSKNATNNDGLGKDVKLVLKNISFVGNNGGYAAVIGPSEVGNTEVTLENCTFTNMYCAVYCGQMEAGAVVDLTIKNCTYVGTRFGYAVYKGYPDYASVTVNVVFENNTTDATYEKNDGLGA